MIDFGRVDPTLLYPPFLSAVRRLSALVPDRFVVTEGKRDALAQNVAYGKGRTASQLVAVGLSPALAQPTLAKVTNAHGGQSPHQFGCAIDVVLDGSPAPGLQPDWTPTPGDAWYRLRDLIVAHCPELVAGATFRSPTDWPHIEWRAWRVVRDIAQLPTFPLA